MHVKESSYLFRLVVTVMHLAFWAELGVITREFLDKLFQLGCNESWGPCLKGGIYFGVLPSNMLGSYVIGLFAASSTLGLKNDKTLAVLPRRHPWQRNFELQIGVRTGFCGSLTTFASWQLEMVVRAVTGSEWISMVASLIIGLYCALVSYVLGMHTGLYIDRWYLPDQEDVLQQTLEYKKQELRALEESGGTEDAAGDLDAVQAELAESSEVDLENWEPDIPSNVPALRQASLRRRSSRGQGAPSILHTVSEGGSQPSSSVAGLTVPGSVHSSRNAGAVGGSYPMVIVEDADSTSACASGGPSTGASAVQGQQAGTAAAPGLVAGVALLSPSPFASHHRQGTAGKGALPPPEPSTISQSLLEAEGKERGIHTSSLFQANFKSTVMDLLRMVLRNKTDLAVLVGLLVISAGLGVGLALERQHIWLRQIWLAGLFAPYGCTLRWWLSRFNYKLQGALAWFPTGTFIANMLGTSIDFGLQCIVQRRGAGLSYWGSLVIVSLQKGYCGSLTTVSTFITEVVKFGELFPETTHAYTYSIVSLGGGAVLGVALYGWSVWA